MPVAELPWYQRTFDRLWLRVYAHRDDDEAERHASRICEWLNLHAGRRVLDLGCGAGRYSRAFARRGLRVTGLDLSEPLLEEARERSPLLPGTPSYVHWDIRRIPFQEQFEGAVSMFTSIGYFDDPEDDRRILRGVHRALVRGGRFLLDFLNAESVRASFVASGERRVGKLDLRESRRIDEDAPGGPAIVKTTTVLDGVTGMELDTFTERVRLYGADELDGMLEAAGFRFVGERMGDLTGVPFAADAPRLVRVVERPARRADRAHGR